MSEEGKDKPEIFDITQFDTYNLLTIFVNILIEKAWQHMGLRAVSGTDKLAQDFKRAQTAIDCIAFLIDKLEPHLPEDIRSKLKNILSDLQVNFVRLQKDKQ